LCAGTAAATGARQKQIGIGKRLQKLTARRHLDRALAIDLDTDIATGDQPATGSKNHHYQREDNRRKHAGAIKDRHIHSNYSRNLIDLV